MLNRVTAWLTRLKFELVVIAGREEAAPGLPWVVLAARLQGDATAHGVAYAWRCNEPGKPLEVLPLDAAFVFTGAEFCEVLHQERRERRTVRLELSEALRIRFGEDALGKLREWLEEAK